MEQTKQFFEQTLRSEEAGAVMSRYERPQTEEETVALYVEIAAQLGVTLDGEHVRDYLTACHMRGEELDEQELAQVGGGYRLREECRSSYESGENCWWEDGCDNLHNLYNSYECSRSSRGACVWLSETETRMPGKLM